MDATGSRPLVVMLVPMPSELRPVVRQGALRASPRVGPLVAFAGRVGAADVLAVGVGIGTASATSATRRVLGSRRVDHAVVVGIAGGVGSTLRLGDQVVPESVVDAVSGHEFRPHGLGTHSVAPRGRLLTGDELIRDPVRLAALADQGVVALDMETAAIAAVCEREGVPWSVFRAISDLADDDVLDGRVGGLARADGSPDLPAVGRYLLRGPWRARHLARLGRQVQVAARAAATAAIDAVREMGPAAT